MSRVEIELDYDGVAELLHSAELENGLSELASGIANKCGSGYESSTIQMGTRVIASVYTETDEAKIDNLKNNTILKNL